MLRVAEATAGCLHPCCHIHFIFADEEKTFTVSSTSRSYSYTVLEPSESLNCLSKAFTGTKSSLQIYTIKKRRGWGLLETPRKEAQDVICSALQSWEKVSLKLMQLSTMMFKEERGPEVCFGRHSRSYAVVVYPCPSWVTNGLCEPQGPLFQALHSPAEANADCSLRGRRGKENGNILWWKQVTLECFSPQSFLLFLFHP